MYTLGINAAFHAPAACLICDGKIIAAAEDERFTHIKHGKRPTPFAAYELPFHAIDYCLRAAGLMLKDVDHVAYSFDPALLLGNRSNDASITLPLEPSAHPVPGQWFSAWDPLFLSSIVNAPRHLVGGVPHHLKSRWQDVSWDGPFQWHFVSHHRAHAASAFYPSPFGRAAVICLDGRGEVACTSYWKGEENRIDLISQVDMPHSLGLLYEDITHYLGFLRSSDEYKVMALASFGKPTFANELRDRLRIAAGGRYELAPLQLPLWFGPPREKGAPLERRHYDLARSLQLVLEETVLELAGWLHSETHCERLCLAGGVALNCVMNSRLRDEGPFCDVWVQPAAGDAGTALGAALEVDMQQRDHKLRMLDHQKTTMNHSFLGPAYDDEEIEDFLRWSKLPYRRLGDIASEAADLLAQDLVVGWFQGRMEFGPRALGARSILASPLNPDMQAKLNEIKDREDFRPVAPAVLEEEAANWFKNARHSPFMLFVNSVLEQSEHLIPAVRHVDGTARIQTVNREQHALYYDLLKAFKERTGAPVLVNTSFNTRGEPIVCSPRDAIECFWTSPLDALVIGSFCLQKPAAVTP